MSENGYEYYETFCQRPPLLVVEWHDTETEAVGWLVINSLKGGAAGGGTRLRRGADKDEAIWLAKTMEIKFMVSGPPIGGAKSVINFDEQDRRKEDVLQRWFRVIAPYLSQCYGTGGDLNVSEKEVIALTQEFLRHPQEGIVRGHVQTSDRGYDQIRENLKRGVEMPVLLCDTDTLTVADMITGYGVAKALEHFYSYRGESLSGKKVLIEGFGAVGGSAAYYLDKAEAKIVGILSLNPDPQGGKYQWLVNNSGLSDMEGILCQRREKKYLPSSCPHGDNPEEFWKTRADIFVPAAKSHTITLERLGDLTNIGVKVIAGGANNPFADRRLGSTEVQQEADKEFTVIADFIANSGMARTFAYLMNENAKVEIDAILSDVDTNVKEAVKRLLEGYEENFGLLERAYRLYVPH